MRLFKVLSFLGSFAVIGCVVAAILSLFQLNLAATLFWVFLAIGIEWVCHKWEHKSVLEWVDDKEVEGLDWKNEDKHS